MHPAPEAIADVFGLGTPTRAPAPLSGGSSASAWVMDTAGGRWVVKAEDRPEDWQLHGMRVAGALETAAHAAGVPMPRPVRPEAFAGLLRGVLNSLAYSVWLAVGHRPVDPGRRARAVEDAREAAAGLPVIVASLGAWSALLE